MKDYFFSPLLVSDDHVLSTFEIICLFKRYLGSKSIVFSLSKYILYAIGYIISSTSIIG